MMNIFEMIKEKCIYKQGIGRKSLGAFLEILEEVEEEYNNGWIPCEKEMPPQPEENSEFEEKPLELYLVYVPQEKYPFRAFWNGKFFSDGISKVDAIAWQPLPEPYQPKGE